MEKTNAILERETVRLIAVDLCTRGKFQPRRHFDQESLNELAKTITSVGVMQPILVRSIPGGRYEIIAGERRWRAAQIAGLDYIPAIVRDVTDDVTASMALIENIQREDLDAIEEAESYERLIYQFDYSHDDLARQLGKSRAVITNALRLIKLPLRVKEWISKGELSAAVGKSLAAIDDPNVINRLAAKCHVTAKDRWSVRKLEAAIKKYNESGVIHRDETPQKRDKPRDIVRLEERISGKIGFPCDIRINAKNQTGEIAFKFNSAAQFEYLLASLKPVSLEQRD